MKPIFWMLGILLVIALFCALMTTLSAKDRSRRDQKAIDELFQDRGSD